MDATEAKRVRAATEAARNLLEEQCRQRRALRKLDADEGYENRWTRENSVLSHPKRIAYNARPRVAMYVFTSFGTWKV